MWARVPSRVLCFCTLCALCACVPVCPYLSVRVRCAHLGLMWLLPTPTHELQLHRTPPFACLPGTVWGRRGWSHPASSPHATRAGSRGSWLWRRGAGTWAVDSSAQGCILDRAPLPAPCTAGHSEQLAPDKCVMWPISPCKIAYDMQGRVATNCSCGLMDKAPLS